MRRETILDIIDKNPGIGFNEIVRQTKLSNGVISHYILQLLKNNEIIKSGIRAKYFLNKVPKRDIEVIGILLNQTNLKIIRVLLEKNTPLKARNIADIIEKSLSTVSISLKKMEKVKMINREIMNQESKLTSDIGFTILNRKFLKEIISKYNVDSKMNQE